MTSVLFAIFRLIFFLVFPFILLIRGSVFFHSNYEWIPWLSVLGGVGVTTLVLMIYMIFLQGSFTGKVGSANSMKRKMIFAMILVLGYSAHALFYFSDANAKSKNVQKEFTSLHPILRLSTSTILFLDGKLIMTDANRVPEDYKKMGLKSKRRSLHYEQSDGYVHALDIRTNGRSEVRNFLMKSYFQLMGFNVLRHVGTDDHLHVSLKSFDSPGAI
ncbi:MAG: hypothetical protein AB8H03_16200 [Saprospiraceae bacterium]